MRKSVVFILSCLLFIPALANAWTLVVSNTNATKDNYATVTWTSGPVAGVKVAVNGSKNVLITGEEPATVTYTGTAPIDDAVTVGGVVDNTRPVVVPKPAAGVIEVKTAFSAAQADYYKLTVVPVNNGVVTIKIGNAQTNSGYNSVLSGTVYTVVVTPNAGYVVNAITKDTSAVDGLGFGEFLEIPGDAGKAATYITKVTGNHDISATIGVSPSVVKSDFSLPAAGLDTYAFGASILMQAIPVSSFTYLWTVEDTANLGTNLLLTGNKNQSISFKPSATGTYRVTVVASTAGAADVTKTGNIIISSGTTNANATCSGCHTNSTPAIVSNYNNSIHSGSSHSACASCHTNAAHSNGVNGTTVSKTGFTVNSSATGTYPAGMAKGAVFCTNCHKAPYAIPHLTTGNMINCASCHTKGGTGDAHAIASIADSSCIQCHASAANAGAGFVQDNSGVRAITTEFAKWSHHVTGVELNDAHCAACHLEGTVVNGKIVTDTTIHMKDATTHLRDTTANTDADFAWNPAAPNHSGMDTYCMSCHDANGAVSPMSVLIQKFINDNGLVAAGKTASATNPFGDTISNRYDKMQRPAVVDASSQFTTTNNSHHAVKGPRYSGRTRTAAGPRAIANLDLRAGGVAVPGAFDNNSSATLYGARSTIYDAGNFNQLYVPLANDGGEIAPRTGAATLGDDSTLHCGDCHTVGQFKPNATVNMNGTAVPTVIGAHGSNNEYLLRNSLGTDAKHEGSTITNKVMSYEPTTKPYLVCYNCHTFVNYGSIIMSGIPATASASHAGVSASGYERCNGTGNTLPFGGYTTGTAVDGTQFESRLPSAGTTKTYGNVFGIQCANCHNSGTGNAYGGIHGSANNQNTLTKTVNVSVTGGAYIDGMGNSTKIQRFLPGLGNAMHVPGTLGGISGGSVYTTPDNGLAYDYTGDGISSDTNWEQKLAAPAAGYAGAGCYTLGVPGDGAAANELRGPSQTGVGGTATQLFDTWGGCDDHNAAQGGGDHGFTKTIIRPVTY